MEGNNLSKIIAGVVVLALVAGGVYAFMGSNDDDMSDDKTTNTTEQATEEAAPQQNIVELAVGTDALSTLVSAVQAADLVETLSDETAEFTVFAPTNDAFAALPDGALDDLLLPENKADLAGVLTYHVVQGKVMAADLSDGQVVPTVNGKSLTVSIVDGVVKINGATVVTADVEANNGVVHVIDSVLLP
jgi:uncharacterized surface protein with fasciclin (FAS1) repeats